MIRKNILELFILLTLSLYCYYSITLATIQRAHTIKTHTSQKPEIPHHQPTRINLKPGKRKQNYPFLVQWPTFAV